MSALNHKRTWPHVSSMSALPPKADMCGATAHVCYGPKEDISHSVRRFGCEVGTERSFAAFQFAQ
jgi:hypothetical protein